VSIGMLIASPKMGDPNFDRTVVLICQHDENGAVGLVINREGPASVSDVLEKLEIDPASPYENSTWVGGPVRPGTGFVLWRGTVDPDEGWNVGDGIAVSPSAERLGKLAGTGTPFALCLGYAGWSPGQLDAEVQSGAWLFIDVDNGIVFDQPMERRYDAALARLGLTAATIVMTPGDA
jgi:putative transcriptional regulator